jgi:hypothetical protein
VTSRSALAVALAVAVAVWFAGCSTADNVFPETGGLLVVLEDTSLGFQSSASIKNQYVIWSIDDIVATIPEFPDGYSFFRVAPCDLAAAAGIDADPRRCGGTALTLEGGITRPLAVTISIHRMRLRRADRPDLSVGGDWDGDGVPNENDNCPIVANPGQENIDEGFEAVATGDACSSPDPDTLDPVIPDQDLDGVRDASDNCLWIANPRESDDSRQLDSNGDGIGDACSRDAPVFLPSGRLEIVCTTSFTQSASSLALFAADFADAVTCDPSFTGCTLDPSKIVLRQEAGGFGPAVACSAGGGA